MNPAILFVAVSYCLMTAAPLKDYNIPVKTNTVYRQLNMPEVNKQLSTGNAAASELYILYPRAKTDKTFYVFLNKKNVARINYGERLEYDCKGDIDLLTVIEETDKYAEPRTGAKNMRNLFLKEGKSYYLQINSKGQLEYIPDEKEGEKLLNDNSRYVSQLKKSQFIE